MYEGVRTRACTVSFLSGKTDRDGGSMATSMKEKIAELEMVLLHLQQNLRHSGDRSLLLSSPPWHSFQLVGRKTGRLLMPSLLTLVTKLRIKFP